MRRDGLITLASLRPRDGDAELADQPLHDAIEQRIFRRLVDDGRGTNPKAAAEFSGGVRDDVLSRPVKREEVAGLARRYEDQSARPARGLIAELAKFHPRRAAAV